MGAPFALRIAMRPAQCFHGRPRDGETLGLLLPEVHKTEGLLETGGKAEVSDSGQVANRDAHNFITWFKRETGVSFALLSLPFPLVNLGEVLCDLGIRRQCRGPQASFTV